MITKGYEISFRGDENVPKLTVVIVAHICDYTETTELYTSMVNCTVCELYLKNLVFNKEREREKRRRNG